MEAEVLLFVEVFGMIGIAAFLTRAVLLDQPVFAGPKPLPRLRLPRVATALYCPEWHATAKVTLGLKPATDLEELGILTCDLIGDSETCDGHCLGPVLQA